MKKNLMLAIAILIVSSMLLSIVSPAATFAESTCSTSKATYVGYSWREGDPFPVVNGHVIYPTIMPSMPPSNPNDRYTAYWYDGSVWPVSQSSQNAAIIYSNIDVPSSSPSSYPFYYVLMSAFDSNGSYDQIGFSNAFGAWGLTYSWSSGPVSDPVYHYDASAAFLSAGVTYGFYIIAQNNVTRFAVYQNSTLFWSFDAPTGGNYLILQSFYQDWVDYTDYEEIYCNDTTTAPEFNFYFHDQFWVATNGTEYIPTWTTWTNGAMPSGINTLIDGGGVYIWNPNVVPSRYPVCIDVSSVNPVPPHYSPFQVYHNGMRYNGQNISMSYDVTVERTDTDLAIPNVALDVGLKRTNIDNASDYRILVVDGCVLMHDQMCTKNLIWNETETAKPGNWAITGFANVLTNNVFDINPTNNQLTNDTVQAKVLIGDVNGDGIVNLLDAILISTSFGKLENDPHFNPDANLNCIADKATGLQIINVMDAIVFSLHFNWDINGWRPIGRSLGGGMVPAIAGDTTVLVDPSQVTAFMGETFSVTVKITSVIDLYGWEFKLYWNSTILNCTVAVVQTPSEWQDSVQNYGPGLESGFNATHSRFWIAQSADYPASSFNGSMSIATLTFQALQPGTTSLALVDVILGNSTAQSINCTVSDGSVTVYYGKYMRSDTQQVNGLSAYKLSVPQSASSASYTKTGSGAGASFGIRAWIRHSNGVEQEISLDGQTGTPTAIVGGGSAAIRSSTVSVAQTALQSTDSLVVRVYVQIADGPWNLCATFTTEQLQSSTLKGATWTAYYYTSSSYNHWTDMTTAKFYWGTTTYNSRIQNLQFS